MSKTNKILISALIGLSLIYLWAKNEQAKRTEKKSSFDDVYDVDGEGSKEIGIYN
jgi:hypothetical protein